MCKTKVDNYIIIITIYFDKYTSIKGMNVYTN